MKLRESKGKMVIVVKGTKCKTFQPGDHIQVLEDGCIMCREAMGWIEKEHAIGFMDMEVEIDKVSIEREKKKLKDRLKELGEEE